MIMREKKQRFVVTFHTTTEAMAMEKACLEGQVSGRLIPVPRQISAGCGLAWSAEVSWRKQVEDCIHSNDLKFDEWGEYWI